MMGNGYGGKQEARGEGCTPAHDHNHKINLVPCVLEIGILGLVIQPLGNDVECHLSCKNNQHGPAGGRVDDSEDGGVLLREGALGSLDKKIPENAKKNEIVKPWKLCSPDCQSPAKSERG